MEEDNHETFSLICLDPSVNGSQAKLAIQRQLRAVINHLKTFTDATQCEQYIRSASPDDRIVLIVNGQLGREIVPRIHQLQQVCSIYISCVDRKKHEIWTNEYRKIKCLITELDELVNQLRYDQTRRYHSKIDEPLSFSLLKENTSSEQQSISAIDAQFVYSQLFIDCLLRMKPISKDKNDLIALCQNEYRGNDTELAIVQEFEREYSSDRALWWYTRGSFLSRLMNKALRKKNFDLLYLFRFFIHDIQQQLEQHRCLTPVRVYRSQLMSTTDLQLLKDSTGKLISINSFLLTNVNRKPPLSSLKEYNITNDLQCVLFEIDADPRRKDVKPLANVTSLSYFKSEQEVLIMLGSIFRLTNIRQDDKQIWIIQMVLCSHHEEELKPIDYFIILKQNTEEIDLLSAGHILIDMSKFDEAEKYFDRLLHELPHNHPNIASCYHALGDISLGKAQYDSSLNWHQKSLEIKMRTLDSKDPNLASSYNSIALVHLKKNDYQRALESYEMALTTFQRAFTEDHPQITACFNNMAMVYKSDKKYREALTLYKKTLTIHQKYLSAEHPDLAMTHTNIGIVQAHLGQYDFAIEHYNRALEIYEKILAPKHPLISMTFEYLGNIHNDKGDFEQGLLYYEKAVDIYRHILPSTHPDVVQLEMAIRRVSSKLKYS